jgi:hypothetical protein
VKKHLLFFILCLFSIAFASAQDIIVTHDGSKLNVKVNYMTESAIIFTIAGETDSDMIGKARVEKIIYKSGRIEPITEKIEVHGKEDWKKIIITRNPLYVIGLTKKGEIHVKSGKESHGIVSYANSDFENMKKQAASMGAHVIVLEAYDARHQSSSIGDDRKVLAYGYE